MRPEIRKAIIRSVLKEQPPSGSTLPDAIDEALAVADEILAARRTEHANLEIERRRHRNAVEAIELAAREATAKCRHWSWTTSTAPYERPLKTCDLCGRELI